MALNGWSSLTEVGEQLGVIGTDGQLRPLAMGQAAYRGSVISDRCMQSSHVGSSGSSG